MADPAGGPTKTPNMIAGYGEFSKVLARQMPLDLAWSQYLGNQTRLLLGRKKGK